MKYTVRGAITSHDVAILVYAGKPIKIGAGEVNGGELPVPQQIAVAHAGSIQIPAHNVTPGVDPGRVRVGGSIRGIDGGELAITQQKSMNDIIGRAVGAGGIALRVDPAERSGGDHLEYGRFGMFAFCLFYLELGRRAAKVTTDSAITPGARPPILYLRAFQSDSALMDNILFKVSTLRRDIGAPWSSRPSSASCPSCSSQPPHPPAPLNLARFPTRRGCFHRLDGPLSCSFRSR